MRRFRFLVVVSVGVALLGEVFAETFEYNGKQRSYVVAAPSSTEKPLGVFILLHPNGGNGGTLIGAWSKIVFSDGVMCVGPNSLNPQNAWRDEENEGIGFIKALLDDVSKRHKIDRKRIYIGGYSAGACHAVRIGLPNSDYFAGIITYAGASGPALGPRKIPVALIHGDKDNNVSVDSSRKCYEMLKNAGWPVWYKEIPGQGHGYVSTYNEEAWKFVKSNPPQDPPEVIFKEKMEEAKSALEKGQYSKAYEAYKAALATGVKKEEAEEGLKKIEEMGEKEIQEALKDADKNPATAKNRLNKIKAKFKGTPVADKAQNEIEKLSPVKTEKPAGEMQKEGEKNSPSKSEATADELMEKAERLLREGNADAAKQCLERLLEEHPDSPLVEKAKRMLSELQKEE
ncbi:MAG: dienelactone hydrolase family protein [Planctomycetota bacterium]|nr:dienelactone hydrolase family protein [Planctomycetota bacterium]